MSILSGRYTGSPETAFDVDIRQIKARGLVAYADSVIENELPPTFWMAKTARPEGMALATLLPSLPAASCNDQKQEIVALH